MGMVEMLVDRLFACQRPEEVALAVVAAVMTKRHAQPFDGPLAIGFAFGDFEWVADEVDELEPRKIFASQVEPRLEKGVAGFDVGSRTAALDDALLASE